MSSAFLSAAKCPYFLIFLAIVLRVRLSICPKMGFPGVEQKAWMSGM